MLAHTFSSNFTEVRINDAPVTEAEVNGLYAASLGVPVGVVTGDDEICAVAAKVFPGVIPVEVKKAGGFAATDTVAPQVARDLIADAVARAVRDCGELRPQPVPERLALEVDFALPLGADFAATVPGTERTSGRTVRAEARDADELIRYVMSWYYLAAHAHQQHAALAARR